MNTDNPPVPADLIRNDDEANRRGIKKMMFPDAGLQEAGSEKCMKTFKLKVSMDGLRRNLAGSYIELVEMLNYTFKNGFEIDKNELEEKLLSLRQDIGVLHCIYDPEGEQFSDLSGETSKMDILTFNPSTDE